MTAPHRNVTLWVTDDVVIVESQFGCGETQTLYLSFRKGRVFFVNQQTVNEVNFVTDKKNLQVQIKEELKKEPFVNRFDIRISVDEDETITLSGSVDNYAQKNHAETLVKEVAADKPVSNELKVGDGSPQADNQQLQNVHLTEDDIREMREFVEEAALNDLRIDRDRLTTTVTPHGVVDLAGSVPSPAHREELENHIWPAAKANYVINRLQVDEHGGTFAQTPGLMKRAAAAARFKVALFSDSLISRPLAVGVQTEGDLAIVQGDVDSYSAKERVIRYAEEYYPDSKVVDELTVAQSIDVEGILGEALENKDLRRAAQGSSPWDSRDVTERPTGPPTGHIGIDPVPPEVKRPAPSGFVKSDQKEQQRRELEQRVVESIRSDNDLSHFDIKCHINSAGTAVLVGTVDSEEQARSIEEIPLETADIKHVVNAVRLRDQ